MDSEIGTLKKLLESKDNELSSLRRELELFKSEKYQQTQGIKPADQLSKTEEDPAQKRTLLGSVQGGPTQNPTEKQVHEFNKDKLDKMEKELESFKSKVGQLEQDKGLMKKTIDDLIFEKEGLTAKVFQWRRPSGQDKEHGLEHGEMPLSAKSKDFLVDADTRSSTQDGSQAEHMELIFHFKEEMSRLCGVLERKDEEIKWYESQTEKMQEEIEGLSHRLYQKELEEIQEDNELERTRHEILNLRETLEETDKQIQELNRKVDQGPRDSKPQLEREDSLSSARELKNLKTTLNEMGHEIFEISEKMRYEKETNIKLQRENEKVVRESRTKEKKLMQQKAEISDLRSALENERKNNSDLEKRMTKLNREIGDKNKKIAKAQKETLSVKKNLESEKNLTTSQKFQPESKSPSNNEADEDLANQVIERMEHENMYLTEKLTKITEDVMLLSKTVTTFQMEKSSLEKEVTEREKVIESLRSQYAENNDLLQLVRMMEAENETLGRRLDRMAEGMELLTMKVIEMQAGKAKLEEEVNHRESIIEELREKYRENSGLLEITEKLEEENERLSQRLERMVRDVGVLSQKFIRMQDEKHQLEEDLMQKEGIVDELTQKYHSIELVLQAYKNSAQGEEATSPLLFADMPLTSSFVQQEKPKGLFSKSSMFVKESPNDLEVEQSSKKFKTLTNLEDHLFRTRGSKSFGINPLPSPTIDSIYNGDNFDFGLKLDSQLRSLALHDYEEPAVPKIAKYLYAKTSRLTQPTFLRIENDVAIIHDTSHVKSGKLTSSQISNKHDKAIAFNKVVQKTNDLELKIFNLNEENLPGRNLFFFVYGSKKTEKKVVKYKIIQDIIDTFKSISQKNPDKVCRVVIRVQDEKFLKKLEMAKNYTALDLFRTHQEFILGEEHSGVSLDDYLTQLKQFDIHGSVRSSRVTPSAEKFPPKEIFLEFLVQSREEANDFLSENRHLSHSSRTKLMIVTTNNIQEERELDTYASADLIIDSILTGNRRSQEDIGEPEKKTLGNSVEKFFVFTVQPSTQTAKNVINTLALAAKFQELTDKIEISNKNNLLVQTPTKKDKSSNIKLLQNSAGNPKSLKKKGSIIETSPTNKAAINRKNHFRRSEVCTTDRRKLKDELPSRRDHEKTAWVIEPRDPGRL